MIKLLLYCTKAKPFIYYDSDDKTVWKSHDIDKPNSYHLNGKIVAECECDKVEEIICSKISNGVGFDVIYDTCELLENELLKKSCLDYYHFGDYFGVKDNEPVGYALHLKNVKIFDEPKELNEYLIFDGNNTNLNNLKPNQYAPQNMKNVYEFCSDNNILLPKRTLEKCILISVRPQHLANILNGKKTIEIRKQILNCLKELI